MKPMKGPYICPIIFWLHICRYIEFYDVMSVPMAIALSGQPLLGQPVMVKPSEAEKNLVQSTASVAGGPNGNLGPYSGGARRLYVGNLHSSITEADLRRVSTFCLFCPWIICW
jgi:RNA-binding protein 39